MDGYLIGTAAYAIDGTLATALASVLVAVVAASASILSARAANKSSEKNNEASIQAKSLDQAYERARALDTETIGRQDSKIDHLEEENEELHGQVVALRHRVETLENENRELKARILIAEQRGSRPTERDPQ